MTAWGSTRARWRKAVRAQGADAQAPRPGRRMGATRCMGAGGTRGPCGHQHVGIRNVRLRLRETCNATLDIQSVPGRGTVAEIRIPKSGERDAA